ncbi:uncharacterized protein LOC106153419 [Lingula anatina]|uniref:Uncharacterized protein LOC106153419 n=1 Tax=Lingula anatina TaxID=7574 RepID=A0A1S3H9W4_LINAN|nr:uncharacterized protein LOC106153419 [Lingula anatina]|eukprot:XP_013382798.1 uncharacterized protein LOC106153419 [Lingula anatina]
MTAMASRARRDKERPGEILGICVVFIIVLLCFHTSEAVIEDSCSRHCATNVVGLLCGDVDECTQYFECVFNRWIKRSCPAGTAFNSLRSTCSVSSLRQCLDEKKAAAAATTVATPTSTSTLKPTPEPTTTTTKTTTTPALTTVAPSTTTTTTAVTTTKKPTTETIRTTTKPGVVFFDQFKTSTTLGPLNYTSTTPVTVKPPSKPHRKPVYYPQYPKPRYPLYYDQFKNYLPPNSTVLGTKTTSRGIFTTGSAKKTTQKSNAMATTPATIPTSVYTMGAGSAGHHDDLDPYHQRHVIEILVAVLSGLGFLLICCTVAICAWCICRKRSVRKPRSSFKRMQIEMYNMKRRHPVSDNGHYSPSNMGLYQEIDEARMHNEALRMADISTISNGTIAARQSPRMRPPPGMARRVNINARAGTISGWTMQQRPVLRPGWNSNHRRAGTVTGANLLKRVDYPSPASSRTRRNKGTVGRRTGPLPPIPVTVQHEDTDDDRDSGINCRTVSSTTRMMPSAEQDHHVPLPTVRKNNSPRGRRAEDREAKRRSLTMPAISSKPHQRPSLNDQVYSYAHTGGATNNDPNFDYSEVSPYSLGSSDEPIYDDWPNSDDEGETSYETTEDATDSGDSPNNSVPNPESTSSTPISSVHYAYRVLEEPPAFKEGGRKSHYACTELNSMEPDGATRCESRGSSNDSRNGVPFGHYKFSLLNAEDKSITSSTEMLVPVKDIKMRPIMNGAKRLAKPSKTGPHTVRSRAPPGNEKLKTEPMSVRTPKGSNPLMPGQNRIRSRLPAESGALFKPDQHSIKSHSSSKRGASYPQEQSSMKSRSSGESGVTYRTGKNSVKSRSSNESGNTFKAGKNSLRSPSQMAGHPRNENLLNPAQLDINRVSSDSNTLSANMMFNEEDPYHEANIGASKVVRDGQFEDQFCEMSFDSSPFGTPRNSGLVETPFSDQELVVLSHNGFMNIS